MWLAACDLDVDDATAQRFFVVEPDEYGRVRLMWRTNVTFDQIHRASGAQERLAAG